MEKPLTLLGKLFQKTLLSLNNAVANTTTDLPHFYSSKIFFFSLLNVLKSFKQQLAQVIKQAEKSHLLHYKVH
jgi:hypothetical protein